jgi:branched-subunit amino acid transport protein
MQAETFWIIVLGCAAATFIWRALGVIVVKRIDADGAFFQWVTCVSYAMVAGLVFRMIILPESQLAEVSIEIRVAAVGVSLSGLVAWIG